MDNQIREALEKAMGEDFRRELSALIRKWKDNALTMRVSPARVTVPPLTAETILSLVATAIVCGKGEGFWDEAIVPLRADFIAAYTKVEAMAKADGLIQ